MWVPAACDGFSDASDMWVGPATLRLATTWSPQHFKHVNAQASAECRNPGVAADVWRQLVWKLVLELKCLSQPASQLAN
jgi:hypothetical protein